MFDTGELLDGDLSRLFFNGTVGVVLDGLAGFFFGKMDYLLNVDCIWALGRLGRCIPHHSFHLLEQVELLLLPGKLLFFKSFCPCGFFFFVISLDLAKTLLD